MPSAHYPVVNENDGSVSAAKESSVILVVKIRDLEHPLDLIYGIAFHDFALWPG